MSNKSSDVNPDLRAEQKEIFKHLMFEYVAIYLSFYDLDICKYTSNSKCLLSQLIMPLEFIY